MPTKHDDDSDLPKSDKKSGPGNTPGKADPDAKDRPETAAIPKKPGDDPNEPKNSPPPNKQPNTPNTIHNRDQDPDHPQNNTPAYRGDPAPRPVAEGVHVAPEEMMTEQEKLAADAGGDPNAGVGPVTPAAYTTGPVETVEDLGIGPRTPYPTGNPPPPREDVTVSQGIWQGDEPEARDGSNVPNKARGPSDPRPQPRIGGPQEMATPPKESGR